MTTRPTLSDTAFARPITLGKKLRFYWTLFRLAVGVLVVLAILLLFFLGAANFFISRHYGAALSLLATGLFIGFLLFARLVILRYHVRRTIHRELRKRHCCPHCAYDLRASVLRCPECGHALRTPNIEI